MRTLCRVLAAGAVCLLLSSISHAGTTVTTEHIRGEDAEPGFALQTVPRPARNDAATHAAFSIVDGRRDPNGGDLDRLHDGQVPSDEDAPGENFFFRAGADGGRLVVDLGAAIEIRQVVSYSWHTGSRAPQVYSLYANDDQAASPNLRPERDIDPATCGWKLLAAVDSRPKEGEPGGQYGVAIGDPAGSLGIYRHLLFEIRRTEAADAFGNTFFSEIDVIDARASAPERIPLPGPRQGAEVVETGGGQYRITIDTSETPDLTAWALKELVPLARDWYPRLAALLSSAGYAAPSRVRILFDPEGRGVAATTGARVRCAAKWFRENLRGEAKGAVFHELVHVVQHYDRTAPQPGALPPPGWLVEGLADYLRWYHFEPDSRGAEISKPNLSQVRYDRSYRITANFLDWASRQHGTNLIRTLNAAMREGRYQEMLWKDLTGHTVQELGEQWKAALDAAPGTAADGDR